MELIDLSNFPHLPEASVSGCGDKGILTNDRYTKSEFKLKFSTRLKAHDVKFNENSKNITFQMIVDYNHFNF